MDGEWDSDMHRQLRAAYLATGFVPDTRGCVFIGTSVSGDDFLHHFSETLLNERMRQLDIVHEKVPPPPTPHRTPKLIPPVGV